MIPEGRHASLNLPRQRMRFALLKSELRALAAYAKANLYRQTERAAIFFNVVCQEAFGFRFIGGVIFVDGEVALKYWPFHFGPDAPAVITGGIAEWNRQERTNEIPLTKLTEV